MIAQAFLRFHRDKDKQLSINIMRMFDFISIFKLFSFIYVFVFKIVDCVKLIFEEFTVSCMIFYSFVLCSLLFFFLCSFLSPIIVICFVHLRGKVQMIWTEYQSQRFGSQFLIDIKSIENRCLKVMVECSLCFVSTRRT